MDRSDLRALIQKAHLTQCQVARKIGVSEARLSLCLAGKRKLAVDMVLPLADTLGVSATDILLAVTKEDHHGKSIRLVGD
jgi:plasmid maintenance system antidote protein VapI